MAFTQLNSTQLAFAPPCCLCRAPTLLCDQNPGLLVTAT